MTTSVVRLETTIFYEVPMTRTAPLKVDGIEVATFLSRGTTANHDLQVLTGRRGTFTGAEAEARVQELSRAIFEAGIRAGMQVAIATSDFSERALLFWAVLALGATPVLIQSHPRGEYPALDLWIAEDRYSHQHSITVDEIFRGSAGSVARTRPAVRHSDGEGEIVSWVLTDDEGPLSLVGRTHLNVVYTGLFASFALDNDRGHTIGALGRVENLLFESLLFASIMSGVHVLQLDTESPIPNRVRSVVETWVVDLHSLARARSILEASGSLAGLRLIVFSDTASLPTSEQLQECFSLRRAGADVHLVLGDTANGIIAEYDFDQSLWQGFPSVDIAVHAAGDVLQDENSAGRLLVRSPQVSAVRRAFSGEEREPAGWSEVPLQCSLRSDGFYLVAHDRPHADGHISSATTPAPLLNAIDILSLIRRSARWRRKNLAIDVDGRTATYGDIVDHVGGLSTLLSQTYSVGAGDRVAIIGRNSLEFIHLYLAANALGAIIVPVNFRLKAPEIAYVLRNSGSKLLVHSDDLAALVPAIRHDVPSDVQFAGFDRLSAHEVAHLVVEKNFPAINPDENRAASILYTAGTTGFPKGAVRSNRNVMWFSFLSTLSELRTHRQKARLVTTPMFHITGHEPAIIGTLTSGGWAKIHSEFNVNAVLDATIKHQVATLFVPPTIGFEMLDQIEKRGIKEQLREFRYWSSASAPLPDVLLARIHALLPWVEVTNTLGMTETGSIAVHRAIPGGGHAPSCVGRAPAGAEVAIITADGSIAARGEPGEIVVRSPQVISGYWENPAATETALRQEWFHGGDIGVYDAFGNVDVKGRLKEMIISGGENVYAAEVENVLLAFPEIREAAVFGRPDPKWGESVTAAVVLTDDLRLTEHEVMARCRSKIAHYKCPTLVVFVDSLPKNPMGKVTKFALANLVDRFVSDADQPGLAANA
ncbi:long-chain fatty acid--CoA ligase (plasmid) [Agrobacterium tumefaciens]|uniref:3-methylmercaptopropionyl-CoA ligase n=2 Tax=Rhizobium/Agrobacterium group TaxID=227290 RepID=A0AAE6BIX5_AGRTU|nr:long-chain fatty acid--CoA ligase [Agrobacterium tumefaciens]QCL82845.1 long-chain fatty acid--CoA ligase [Agrobacterium tumefaciens]